MVPAYMPCRVSLPRGPWNKCGKEPLNNQEPTFFREDDIFAHVYLTPTKINKENTAYAGTIGNGSNKEKQLEAIPAAVKLKCHLTPLRGLILAQRVPVQGVFFNILA